MQVTFDPDVITYRDVLDIFFSIHDPTTLNRQGNDVATRIARSSSTTMQNKSASPRRPSRR